MSKFFELFTNTDGRASTTGFIQFFGFIILAGVLVYSVYLDREVSSDFYLYFALFCGGQVVSKGVVTAYKSVRGYREEQPNDNE
jgi:hypothetical protein|nr:MAG TPA: Protein of unknown function (DUF2644) [Caudoviricetes sp.]